MLNETVFEVLAPMQTIVEETDLASLLNETLGQALAPLNISETLSAVVDAFEPVLEEVEDSIPEEVRGAVDTFLMGLGKHANTYARTRTCTQTHICACSLSLHLSDA